MDGTQGEPTAFYFDRAVFTFGSALEDALEKASADRGKKKKSAAQVSKARQRVMSQWLGVEQKYADPVAARG